MTTGKLSSKSQVTVPSEVREAVGLRPGDTILWEVRDREAVIRRVEPFDLEFHRALGATLDEWTSAGDEEAFADL